MKHITAIPILFLSLIRIQAQEPLQKVSSSITQVTIFLSGAEIQREGKALLKAGAQQLLFENLPQAINPQSIQVSGTGNFTILNVSHRINYLKSSEKSKEAESLETALKSLEDKIAQQAAAVSVLKAEEEMLKENQTIGGTQNGVKTAELKEFADYFRTRLNDLSLQLLKANKETKAWTEEKKQLENQLRAIQAQAQTPTGEIVVEVTAPAAGNVTLALNYLAYNAGWTPSYDLRSSDINNPVELTYKANVRQSTGEAWTHIKPVFSTANPTLNNTKPVLMPWFLSFYEPMPRIAQSNAFQKSMAPAAMASGIYQDNKVLEVSYEAKEFTISTTAADFSTVQESQTSVEFVIDIPYTIPADGQTHSVELAKHALPASYEYYAVRKLEKDVFLLAKVTGWEKLNLLSGPANLFFEGKFVGESYIETRQTDDTLSLSLGRDKNITVTRIRKRDFSEKQLLGSNVTETREWDLTVHNKKSQEITITLEDQIPVSAEKEIRIEALNITQADWNKDTGKLCWTLTLKPSESRTMNVKYSVRYPKGKTVVLE